VHPSFPSGQVAPRPDTEGQPRLPRVCEHFRAFVHVAQQIAELDLAVEWKKVDVPVLVTWGTSNPTTTAEENRYLVEAINSFHPGRATYAEFPRMGHGLDLSSSPRAWLEAIQKHQHGEFDEEFLERVDSWLSGQLRHSAK